MRRLPLSLSAAGALTLVAGLATTGALCVAVSQLEDAKLQLAFEQRAAMRVAAIGQGLEEAVEVLTVTNHLFASVAPVSRQQFHDFTAPLLLRYPFIKAFNFHRQLDDAERPGFEQGLRRVRPGSVITEMAHGAARPAPRRAHYNVVEFLEPMAGNEAAFGLDVARNAQVTATLTRAIDSGQASATRLLSLIQDTRPQAGFLVMLPVYREHAALGSAAERRAALMGDTAAIIRAGELVQKILASHDLLADPAVAIAVYASGADGRPQQVFHSGAALAGLPLIARSIDVAGQRWRIEVAAAPRPYLSGEHLGSLLVAVGGAALSLLLAALVQAMAQRARRVEALVRQRTADLELSNQRLIDDVIERRRAEHALLHSEARFRQLVSMSSDWYWEQDAQCRFTALTGAFTEKSGIGFARYAGKTRWETIPGMQESAWGQAHIADVQAHRPFSALEYATETDQGETRWFCINGEPVFEADGAFAGYRGTGTDITERKLSEQRIQHVAQHDALTGLPNRSLLQDRLGQAIAYSVRCHHPVWVMLIDLDRFKFVNDSMGHKAGDVL
ncbi:MAG: CHASE domain-containing protein, partial [Pseudomonadota bacterium]|nr:CHASE domain-containing protein [Pseudomonadota bacterium]